MTSVPRYIVAKYAPDLHRMEPKNIGVIVWAAGHAASKFLESEDADFVTDPKVFDRWVRFWEAQTRETAIRIGHRKPVPRNDPAFVDEFCRTQKGNFLLFDGGRVHEDLAASNLEDAAAFLFDELVSVARQRATLEPNVALKTKCDSIVGEAGLTRRDDWQGQRSVRFPVEDIEQEFEFHYVVGNGSPKAVGHRVPLKQLHVNSAAFLFEWLGKSVVRRKENRLALVDTSAYPDVEMRIGLLDRFASVVDVADARQALRKLNQIE